MGKIGKITTNYSSWHITGYSNQQNQLRSQALSSPERTKRGEERTWEQGCNKTWNLFIYLTFSLSGEGHCYWFPQLQQALLYRFVVEEVTVNNTGISLLLSTSVWVLLSPPIERRETRPTV